MMTMLISDIRVGEHRHRGDLGDIEALAESIRDIGLLHPVVFDQRNNLLAGRRRLEAARLLGWTSVAVRIMEVDPCA
jgi:ParB family chromosome partitioning protein